MDERPSTDQHSLLHTEFHWTPRQREVLDLIARDKTNQEIADTLGVSLDGAKWHMREILSKLNVERREDAAEYWRLHNGWQPRLGRAWRSLAGVSALKLSGTAVVGAVLLFASVAVVLSLRDNEPHSGAPPAEANPSVTASPAAPLPSPTLPPPPPTPRQIVLDTSERPQPAETTRVLGSPPDSVFPPWNGVATVIYDIQRGVAIDLGPGAQPAVFSPDSTTAVWTVGPQFGQGTEAFVIDLATGAKRSLGPARLAGFRDDETAVTVDADNVRHTVDVNTGEATLAADDIHIDYFPTSPDPSPQDRYVIDPPGFASPDLRTYTIRDPRSDAVLLILEAVAVTSAGPDHVAAVSAPIGARSNVYLIEVATGLTTFVATAIPGVNNFPFSADEQSILWTDGYCGDQPGMVTLFDRATAQITRLDFGSVGPNVNPRWARLAPEGQIAIGSFGAADLIDRHTLAFRTVLPPRPDGYGGDVTWSANYRYASHGPYGGHGGLC